MGGSAPAGAGRPLVRTRLDGAVAVVMLDSPENRNALSLPVVTGLIDALATAAEDDEVRVVVLVSEGEVFCSGVDLTDVTGAAGDGAVWFAEALLDVLRAIVTLPKPVVTRIHGEAVGAGLGIVGASDLAIAEASAVFGFTETRMGLAPAVASLTTLARITPHAASRAYLTGVTIDATIANEIGLVNQVVPDDMLDTAVDVAVAGLLAGSPQGLAATKELLTRPIRADLAAHGDAMVALTADLYASAEAHEGIAAAAAGRLPRWAVPD